MRGYIIALFLALLPGMASAEIKVSPSYVERQLGPGTDRVMCTSVGLAMDAMQLQRKLPGCGDFKIHAPCVRGYEKVNGVTYSIIAIGPPGNQRFWYERGRIRTKKFCRV